MSRPGRTSRGLGAVGACTALATAMLGLTAWNARTVRRPGCQRGPSVDERVSILVPARDEAPVIEAAVRSALAQEGLGDLEVIVLDDGSSDATAAIVARIDDPRLRLVRAPDAAPPAGWLGKPWACQRLGELATGSILAFIDADVVLEPGAIAACARELRAGGLALLAPYPRQLADGPLPRLVQPLLTWSWMAMIPLRYAEESARASLSAANGQLLVFDAAAYRAIGGHACVAGEVIEDVALMRAVRAGGGRAATADGSGIAECRMYASGDAVVDGYAKSLWSAFGGPTGTVGACALLAAAFIVPPLAAVAARDGRTRAAGAAGYAAGAVSRAIVAQRTGERVPDALAHPASIAAFVALNAVSWHRHRRGTNTWKGRPVA